MSFKKMLALLLCAAFLLCASSTALAEAIPSRAVCSGTCGQNASWSLNTTTGVLSITGTGKMKDYYSNAAPWYNYRNSILSIVVGEGITKIGSFSFFYAENASSVSLPSTLKTIGGSAFFHCSSLVSIDIPDGVTSIEYRAFSFCSSLASIDIPEGVTSIEDETFYSCPSLASIDIPEGVTSIGEYAFLGCSSLASVDIPEGVTSIGESAFKECSLSSVTVPAGVTVLGNASFADNPLSSAVFLGAPPSAGEQLFSNYADDFCIYYLEENAESWAPNGETEWNGYDIAPVGSHILTITYLYENGGMAAPTYTAAVPQGAAFSVESPSIFGWSASSANIAGVMGSSNLYYTVTYTSLNIPTYTVTFLDWNGTILKTETVYEGQNATPPPDPEREGYTFVGWTGSYENVNSDRMLIALYEVGSPEPTPTPTPDPTPTPTPVPGDAVTFTVSSGQALPGGHAVVSVDIEGEYAANGLTLWLGYDSELFTFEEALPGEACGGLDALGSIIEFYTDTPGWVGIGILVPQGTMTASGELFSVCFGVSEDAETGASSPMTVTVGEFYTLVGPEEREAIPYAEENGGITFGGTVGDVDGSGTLDSFDALMILRHALGVITLSPEKLAYADASGDGTVDSFDALLVLRTVLGLLSE